MTDIALIRQELENSVREYCSKQEMSNKALFRLGHADIVSQLLADKVEQLGVTHDVFEEAKSLIIEIVQRFIKTTDFDTLH